MRAENERSRCRFKRAIREAFNQGDGLSWLLHHAEPTKVGAHDADELITDFLGVHYYASACGQETIEFVEKHATPLVDVVTRQKWHVSTGHSKLVVGMQIVGGATDVHDAVKIVLAQPDDLFLATYLSMARSVPAGAFADCQLILHDPDEITGLDSKRPLATEFLRHRVTMLPHARDVNFEPLVTAPHRATLSDVAGTCFAARDGEHPLHRCEVGRLWVAQPLSNCSSSKRAWCRAE